MPSILTRERVGYYCTVLLISALGIQLFSLIRDRQIGGDFVTLYAEGKVALNYPHSLLYNLDIQEKEYAKVWGANVHSPFGYTPWFTIPLALLARSPYLLAFGLWTLMSVMFLVIGFWLTARAVGLPASWNYLASLSCLAFPPYLFYSLINGQPSSFALFILALTYLLQKNGRQLMAGLALALLTYKPTLLVFIAPMLLFTRQWRLFLGLVLGSAILTLVSLLWAGVEGITGFLKLMALYTQAINSQVEVFQTAKYIDIGAAVRLLIGPHPIFRWVLLFLVFPFVCFLWYRIGPRPLSWSLAIVFGLLLNVYTPIYDSTLIIFAVILIGITTLDSWLVAALYLIPLVTVPIAQFTGLQLYTIVLIAFSVVLVRRSLSSDIGHL
jgi:hypothetical protein